MEVVARIDNKGAAVAEYSRRLGIGKIRKGGMLVREQNY